MRTLVAGWFSFTNGHATAGDLLACDVACEWLTAAGWAYDIALAPPFEGGVELDGVDPACYSHLLFVCGPFEQGELEARLLSRFGHCRLIGLNLSMQVPLDQWNPFDHLIERDSTRAAHADLVFASTTSAVPVVGVCRVEPFPGACVDRANDAIDRLVASTEIAVVKIDTRLDVNAGGLRTPAEIESVISRMDVLVTTRLHGMVLALKHGVPVIVIDPIAGGAKIKRHAQTIGWPLAFAVDDVTDEAVLDALEYCRSPRGRVAAAQCGQRARGMVEELGKRFIATLADGSTIERNVASRRATDCEDGWMRAHVAADAPRPLPCRPRRRSLAKRVAQFVHVVHGLARNTSATS